MRFRSITKLDRLNKWLKGKVQAKALILLYHRIVAPEQDPQLLAVAPAHFEQHLDVIQKYYHPLSLAELCRAIKTKAVPPHSIVITFDDGYSDNLYFAKPLLEKFDIPATVFVTGGPIGKNESLWWDELARIFLQPGHLPRVLELTIDGQSYRWDLNDLSDDSTEKRELPRLWNVLEKADPGSRQTVYRSLYHLIRNLASREKIMAEIRLWAGGQVALPHADRVMSPQEISLLAKGNLVDVGSHTMTHPVLAKLPSENQQKEIIDSKRCLEEIIGHPVAHFAYPYGSRADYTSRTVTLVKKAGFLCACSNYLDVIWRYSNPYQLPRAIVRDWNGDQFFKKLQEYFHD